MNEQVGCPSIKLHSIKLMSTKQIFYKILEILLNSILLIFFMKSTASFSYYYRSALDVIIESNALLAIFYCYILVSKQKELTWFNFFPASNITKLFMLFMIFIIQAHLYHRFQSFTITPDGIIFKPTVPIDNISIYIWIITPLILLFFGLLAQTPLFLFKDFKLELSKFHYINSRLKGVVFLYILTDIIFAFVYRIHSIDYPCSFYEPISSFIDAFYFSTVTFTTLGYGDITPVDQSVRFLAAEEAIIGVIFIGVIVAVAINLPPPLTQDSKDTPEKSISGKDI